MKDSTSTNLAVSLVGRACPICGEKDLRWVKKAHKSPVDSVLCRNRASCKWAGPYFESIPRLRRPRNKTPDRPTDRFTKILQESFNTMLDGNKAVDEFEDHLLNNSHGDPDEDGSDAIRSYVRRLAQLKFFIQLMDIVGIKDEEHKKHLIANEIDRMFTIPGSR